VDKRILAQRAQHSPTDQEHQGSEERDCFYCLEGWIFLGSLGHDGEEVVDCIRCRRCGGTGKLLGYKDPGQTGPMDMLKKES
jgi:hypothetical protein